jgi:NADH dehydrogenase
MTRDNLRSMAVDNVCDCAWPDVFGFAPSRMEDVVPAYLGGAAPRDRYASVREARGRRDPAGG